jgi:hypothetical protein
MEKKGQAPQKNSCFPETVAGVSPIRQNFQSTWDTQKKLRFQEYVPGHQAGISANIKLVALVTFFGTRGAHKNRIEVCPLARDTEHRCFWSMLGGSSEKGEWRRKGREEWKEGRRSLGGRQRKCRRIR